MSTQFLKKSTQTSKRYRKKAGWFLALYQLIFNFLKKTKITKKYLDDNGLVVPVPIKLLQLIKYLSISLKASSLNRESMPQTYITFCLIKFGMIMSRSISFYFPHRHQWLPSAAAARTFKLEFLKSCTFPQKSFSFLLAAQVKLPEILVMLKCLTFHTSLCKNSWYTHEKDGGAE